MLNTQKSNHYNTAFSFNNFWLPASILSKLFCVINLHELIIIHITVLPILRHYLQYTHLLNKVSKNSIKISRSRTPHYIN